MTTSSDSTFKRDYQTHVKHLQLKGLQPKTIEAYSRAIRYIGDWFEYQIRDLTEEELLEYFSALLKTHSWSTVKLDLYGLKFFYRHVLHKPWENVDLIKPPKAVRLPDIVTINEAARLFQATSKLSYRVFYFTVYSLGLRLEVGDVDAGRQRVHIRDAKGNKDRFVPLPETTLAVLRHFWSVHRNPIFLFPNRKRGLKGSGCATTPLDRGGIQTTIHKVVAECGIKKKYPHTRCVTAMQPI